MSTLVLQIEPHQGEAFTHQVNGDSLVLGRSSQADLVIPDRYISRLQARLYRDGDRWMVEDLGGRNPTLLNGKAVAQAQRVVPGDLITVCDSRIHVQASGGPDQDWTTASGHTLFREASALLAAEEGRNLKPDIDEASLRHHTDRLRLVNEFHRALAAPISLKDLLELVLDRAFADLRPEEGVIYLRKADGEFESVASRRVPGISGDFLFSRSLIREVTEKQLAALVVDVGADERFSAAQSMLSSGARSVVAAPLFDPDGCRGLIVLNSRAHLRSFSEEDMEELVSLAAAAAMRIRNLALVEEASQRKVLEKELSLARQIQMTLLPAELPKIEGFELSASNIPNRAVSGDLYQVQTRREGTECVLLLADVSGKGMAAALLTASLEALAAGPIEVGLPPDGIFSRLSRRLHARTSAERYATAFAAVLHRDSGRFCYTNAGHNPAILLRASGEHEELGATGLPLGLLPASEYGREVRQLGPGDLVIIYTDGVTEAANPAGEEYGLSRLLALGQSHRTGSVHALAAALQADLYAFASGVPFGDDQTFLLLKRLN
ncbi:MAG TPA: SpoIIE family protein phosphatase [Vicinamibacteria bacterium]|nr:SpoIIE family protein phosphatase [Vicinamibacteria bacterium]